MTRSDAACLTPQTPEYPNGKGVCALRQARYPRASPAPPCGPGRPRNPCLSDPPGRAGTGRGFHAQRGVAGTVLFLDRDVLPPPFPALGDLEHARKSRRVPVVFARQDVPKGLAQLVGLPHLLASLLSGTGRRLMACVRLRVKDIDFAYHQLTVRDGKGAQDRVTMLPQSFENVLGVAVRFPSLQTVSRSTFRARTPPSSVRNRAPKGGQTGETPGGSR